MVLLTTSCGTLGQGAHAFGAWFPHQEGRPGCWSRFLNWASQICMEFFLKGWSWFSRAVVGPEGLAGPRSFWGCWSCRSMGLIVHAFNIWNVSLAMNLLKKKIPKFDLWVSERMKYCIFLWMKSVAERGCGCLGAGGLRPRETGAHDWWRQKGRCELWSWGRDGTKPKGLCKANCISFPIVFRPKLGLGRTIQTPYLLNIFKGSHCKTSVFLNLIHYRFLHLMKWQFNKWYNCPKYCFNIIMCNSLEHAIAFYNYDI